MLPSTVDTRWRRTKTKKQVLGLQVLGLQVLGLQVLGWQVLGLQVLGLQVPMSERLQSCVIWPSISLSTIITSYSYLR